MEEFWILLGLMVFGHALADYPLQGDFLSRAKNATNPIPGVPWYQALGAHSAIPAGFVGVLTGSLYLAIAELLVHAWTDDQKCRGNISYNTDQAIHIGCKVMWAAIAVASA